MSTLRVPIVFVMFFLSQTLAFAKTTISSKLRAKAVRPGDAIELIVTLQLEDAKNVGELELPKFQGLEVVNQQQSTSVGIQMINGSFSQSKTKTTTLTLSTQNEGTYTIPPIRVKVDGKFYQTRPHQVQVTDSAQAPPEPQDEEEDLDPFSFFQRRAIPQVPPTFNTSPPPGQAIEQNFEVPKGRAFLWTSASKTSVFTGEALKASYYLYLEDETVFHSVEIQQLPKLPGFYKEDLFIADSSQRISWEGVKIRGKFYKRALLLDYQLFPLGQGKKKVDPVKAKVATLNRENLRRQFGFGFNAPHAFPMASRSIEIEVKPLPEAGRPKDFLGAVGEFQLSVAPIAKELTINKAFTLSVKVSGQGAFHAIDELSFQAPEGLEFFDTKISQNKGEKIFEYVFIPRKPGELTFPEIKLAYFNPKTEKYAVEKTPQLNFVVSGHEDPTANSNLPPKTSSPEKEPTHPPIVELPNENLWEKLNQKWFVGLGLLLWLVGFAYLLIQWWQKKMKAKPKPEPQFRKIAKEWLKKPGIPPSTAQIDEMKFAILEAIRNAYKDLHLPHSGKSRSAEIQLQEMGESGLPKEVTDLCQRCFLKLDRAGFGATTKTETSWSDVLNELSQLLKTI